MNTNSEKPNHTLRYLKYAIGEIFLVVVGILIALQINNWNENRKLRATEVNLLKQLNIDLKANLDEIKTIKIGLEDRIKAGKNILDFLDSDKIASDSLSLWIEDFSGRNIFNNANSTYKNLQNSNENIISNDSLRLAITLMYEKEFANIQTREQAISDNFSPAFKNELHKYFKVGPRFGSSPHDIDLAVNIPKNSDELRQNDSFKNALVDLYNFRKIRLTWISLTHARLEKLISDINSEILKLSDN